MKIYTRAKIVPARESEIRLAQKAQLEILMKGAQYPAEFHVRLHVEDVNEKVGKKVKVVVVLVSDFDTDTTEEVQIDVQTEVRSLFDSLLNNGLFDPALENLDGARLLRERAEKKEEQRLQWASYTAFSDSYAERVREAYMRQVRVEPARVDPASPS